VTGWEIFWVIYFVWTVFLLVLWTIVNEFSIDFEEVVVILLSPIWIAIFLIAALAYEIQKRFRKSS
jgi:hypothetical protein